MIPSRARILFTGATGFLGKSVLECLDDHARAGADFKVFALSRNSSRFLQNNECYHEAEWLDFIDGDIMDFRPPVDITHILHAAADTHSTKSKLQWAEQIVGGTQNVLNVAARAGARRLLFISSGAVYGSVPVELIPIKENCAHAPSPLDTQSLYGSAKRFAETLCAVASAQSSLECVVARCFALVSPHIPLSGPYAVGNFIRDALNPKKNEITVTGDGTAIRTYIDGRDMAEWCLKLLFSGQSGRAYNIGGEHPISMLALATMISEIAGTGKRVSVQAQTTSERSLYYPSTEAARALGLQQKYSIEQMLKDTIQKIKKRGSFNAIKE